MANSTDTEKSPQHRAPTEKTIKQLYGTAIRCAFPKCKEPLYKQEGKGDALNSEVAHIHARSRGGCRWLEGMTEKDNRSKQNLLLLCPPHHSLVDDKEHEETYTAEMLQEWKKKQLKRGAEAPDRKKKLPSKSQMKMLLRLMKEGRGSDRTEALERATARLIATVQQSRVPAHGIAARWKAEVDRTQRDSNVWEVESGNRPVLRPPNAVKRDYEDEIRVALTSAVEECSPLCVDVETELAMATSSATEAGPWSSWLQGGVTELMKQAGSWPSRLWPNDDEPFLRAVEDLRAAQDALSRRLQGKKAPAPPELAASADSTTEFDRQLARHGELLQRCSPFLRAENRPYDADLRAEVIAQVAFASQLPFAHPFLSLGLIHTAITAAYIARRATDEEITGIIEEDRERRPVFVAAELLTQLEDVLEKDGRSPLATKAHEELVRFADSFDYSDAQGWQDNEAGALRMLDLFAMVTSSNQVRDRIAAAASSSPEIAGLIVFYTARTSTLISHETGQMGHELNQRRPPEWLPVEELVKGAGFIPVEDKHELLIRLLAELEATIPGD